jgi:hypothetical protein
VSFPVIESDPEGEKMRLQPCHVGKPFKPTSEHDAASDFLPGSAGWSLLMKIATMRAFSVEHGRGESFICYRGYRVGGVDRKKRHWFVSKTLGSRAVDKFLEQMKFRLESGHFGSTPQGWYQLEFAQLGEFEHAVVELSKAIDRQLGFDLT